MGQSAFAPIRMRGVRPQRADRSPARIALLSWGAAAILLFASAAAHAQSAAPPIRVQTRETVHEGCPRSPSIAERLKVRSARIMIADSTDAEAVQVEVDVKRDGAWSRGAVTLDFKGERTVRTADALSCEEVLGALAAMAVVALDTLPDAPPATPEPEAPARPEALQVSPSTAIKRARPRSRPTRPDSPRRRVVVGTGFAVRVLGHDPAVAVREVYVQAAITTTAGATDTLARLAPSLRVGLSRSTHAEIASIRGPASLVWTTVDVRGCVDLVHFARMNAGPCAAGAFGELDAQAFAPAIPTSRGRPWITVGALARLRLRVLPPLSIEGDVGLARPLVRDAIFFEPARVIYEAPALVPSVGLAITAELP